jgi:hypothetical protein
MRWMHLAILSISKNHIVFYMKYIFAHIFVITYEWSSSLESEEIGNPPKLPADGDDKVENEKKRE